ncbi:hypothetical protein COLO4_37939 [Corchorus olitorius]|uniref:Protein FAR1-RELATED SEQUENCE n=1 Tax=Corchorus olitorius TaxID=93759 RepID=A0A1R3FXV4_9ROSI|nr:hypothetical protein COLO4_37939 [Corchorus olitorius]
MMRRTSKCDDDENVKYICFACSKTQKRELQSNSFTSKRVTKTRCEAKIRLILCDEGQFQVPVVELDHDHLLRPGKAHHLKCNRKLIETAKRRLEINDEARIGAGKNYHSLVVEVGGYENVTFNGKDCRNYIEQARHTRLGVGEAEAVCKYFAKMQEFVELYDVALKSKVEKENLADYQSFNSWYECLSDYDIEKQFQRVYTNDKFKEFQDELKGKFYFQPSLMKTENLIYEYKVEEDVKVGEKRKDVAFLVQFNEFYCEVNCKCRLFEFRGILCRHALSVLIHRRVNEVPQKYILSRWREDLKRRYNFIKSSDNPLRPQIERCERMSKELQKFTVLAADFEDKYELALKGSEELKAKVANDELIDNQTVQRWVSPSQSCADNRVPSSTNKVLSPLVTQRRGRPSTKRKIPRIEEVIPKLKNKKKVEQVKENVGSNKSRTKKNLQQRKEVKKCEDTCLSSQNCNGMQSLESFNLMGNRAPFLGGYYPLTPFAPNIYHSSQESENPYTFESNKDQHPKM